MSNSKPKYIVSINSINKSLELFNNAVKACKKKETISSDEDSKTKVVDMSKYKNLCNSLACGAERKRTTSYAFNPTFALVEMRLCLMKHDWDNLQRLLLLLLNLSSRTDTLLWRYALIIFMYSPMSNLASLQDFLQSCAGTGNENLNEIIYYITALKEYDKRKKRYQSQT